MATVDSELADYKNDNRIPCKYGVTCYQKNSAHHSKYKHPPKSNKRKHDVKNESSKKTKLDNTKEEEEINNLPVESQGQEVEDLVGQYTKEGTSKNECISNSSSESEGDLEFSRKSESQTEIRKEPRQEVTDELESTYTLSNPKDFIKANFLINMPDDFYEFWEFCKELNATDPCDAFKDVGLKLVGTYDVLAGNFNNIKKLPEEYLRHWRYYYDPPELQTVLKGDDQTGYHIGYFFDSPHEPPAFLVSNHGVKDGILTKMGDNIFAAVGIYLEELKKIGDPFKKVRLGKLFTSLRNKAEKLNLNMSSNSEKIKQREKKVVARTFNKVGLVVPYNRKTQLGYRDLAMSDNELMTLLNKLDKALPEQKAKYLSDLQPVLTYANIALDECDFGTGVKLGWQLLYHGTDSLNSTILQFLSNSYKYLKRDAFAKIAEAHLTKRIKGCKLSIL